MISQFSEILQIFRLKMAENKGETFDKKGCLNLTEAEKEEIEKFPIPSEPTTPERLQLRKQIGKKMCDHFNRPDTTDGTLTERYRKIYTRAPMWKFYTDKQHSPSIVRRAYGVAIGDNGTKEGEDRLHMVSLRLFWINDVVGGVPVDDVDEVEDWTTEQKEFIKLSLRGSPAERDAFLDPLGFFYFLKMHHE